MALRSGVAFCLFLAACAANPPIQVMPGQKLAWDDAVTLLNTGEVVSFAQFHSLEVELELANGTRVFTRQPAIDEIFRELERCWRCGEVSFATD